MTPSLDPHVTSHAQCREAQYGRALSKYLDDPGNLFIISSDFCHWGDRFNFTFYDEHQV